MPGKFLCPVCGKPYSRVRVAQNDPEWYTRPGARPHVVIFVHEEGKECPDELKDKL